MDFPKHKCGLYLTHNEHLDMYETAEEWLTDETFSKKISAEDKSECIQTGEIWQLQWYPETSLGFCQVIGPTLERVLQLASEVDP